MGTARRRPSGLLLRAKGAVVNMNARRGPAAWATGRPGQPEDQFLLEAAQRPLRRYARPEEIAHAVLYLASNEASFITGTALVIDGGGTA
jgi:NAD(P)-dependent dehydrogenase (short-subunit alcohol dehydrogenase family)